MAYTDVINRLNDGLIAADPDDSGDFELAFAQPDNADDIARFEDLIGTPLPPALRDLYLEGGAFAHVHFANAWQTLRIDPVRSHLASLPLESGLVAFIHSTWGGREELAESLDDFYVETVNANYTVFGWRYIDDNVHDYLYFDRNGLFGNFRFDQDEASHNLCRLRNLAEILPEGDLDRDARLAYVLAEVASFSNENTFPGASLDALLESQFAAITDHLEEQ